MSPVVRTSLLGCPIPARTAWLTGGAVASLALMFTGIADPAVAATRTVAPAADIAVKAPSDPSTGDDCKKPNGPKHPGHKEKPGRPVREESPDQPAREGKAAQPPAETPHERCEVEPPCADIDTYAPSRSEEFSAVLSEGVAYAGRRRLTPSVGDYHWQDLTEDENSNTDNENFPEGACAISISARGNDAWIKVLTTDGEVWETHGDVNGQNFVWDEDWYELDKPEDLRSTRAKGDFATDVAPNSVERD